MSPTNSQLGSKDFKVCMRRMLEAHIFSYRSKVYVLNGISE
jgi:hypothetical protein